MEYCDSFETLGCYFITIDEWDITDYIMVIIAIVSID